MLRLLSIVPESLMERSRTQPSSRFSRATSTAVLPARPLIHSCGKLTWCITLAPLCPPPRSISSLAPPRHPKVRRQLLSPGPRGALRQLAQQLSLLSLSNIWTEAYSILFFFVVILVFFDLISGELYKFKRFI